MWFFHLTVYVVIYSMNPESLIIELFNLFYSLGDIVLSTAGVYC